jgi:hypothetical protein
MTYIELVNTLISTATTENIDLKSEVVFCTGDGEEYDLLSIYPSDEEGYVYIDIGNE